MSIYVGAPTGAGHANAARPNFAGDDDYADCSESGNPTVDKADQAALRITGPTDGTYGQKLGMEAEGGQNTPGGLRRIRQVVNARGLAAPYHTLMVVTRLSERGEGRHDDPIRVDILGGDPVAGQALELLLQGIGCNARFVAEPVADDAGEWLDRVQLLLIPSTLRPERREALLSSISNGPRTARVPIIKLVDAPRDGKSARGRYVLSWPCRVEELMRRIEAAVADRPEGRCVAYG